MLNLPPQGQLARLEPEQMTRQQSTAIAWALSGMETGASGQFLVPAERMPNSLATWLLARSETLRCALDPATRDEIESVVEDMLLGYPTSATEQAPELRCRAYANVLGGFPIWAIDRAIRTLRSQYCPSAGALAQSCVSIVSPWIEESSQISRLLSARPVGPNDADRKRIADGLRDLADQMRQEEITRTIASGDLSKLPPKFIPQDVAAARVAEMEANPVQLPPMSGALREVINKQNRAAGLPELPEIDEEYLRQTLL